MSEQPRAQPWRLPAPAGVSIARDRVIDFTFDGRAYRGYEGDTVASALHANGVRVLSRSFKYHRPRGVLTMRGAEANTLVRVDDEPNVLADVRLLAPGTRVLSQNHFGGLERDHARVLDRLGRFLPVGFYYKAFFRPKGAWRLWQGVIRRLAGLGTVDRASPHRYYDKAYLFHDVVVVGGGAAGMAAAAAAANAGAEVLLIEENPELGGALGYARFDAEGRRAEITRARLARALDGAPGVDVMTGAVCTGLYADNWLAIVKGNRLYKARAKAVVVAAGAFEQPMVFRNNDLPGVMLGSAAQRLIKLHGVRPGARAVVVAANGEGYGVALDLAEAGVEIACIADPRPEPAPDGRAEEALARRMPVIAGAAVSEAVAGPGLKSVTGARVARVLGDGRLAETSDRYACDLIVTSTGFMPLGNLLYHRGARAEYDEARAGFAIAGVPSGVYPAGAVNGFSELDGALADGRLAGWAAARAAGLEVGRRPPKPQKPKPDTAPTPNHPWPIFPHPAGRDFVDFDEDLQVKDIEGTVAEGFTDMELLKRYSTLGMGPSQGKHSALAAARLAARAVGAGTGAVPPTTSRPPYRPVKFGLLAGRTFQPVRQTAMHARHLEAGAAMMPAGLWLRPAYYGEGDERAEAIRAEARAVRENVGLIDVSTLGGLEVRGPDAAEFLERVYTFAYAKQPVGRARYVLMTDLSGVIVDDGIAARLHERRFYVTATTGGVDGVYQKMLWHNAQWRLDVDVTNVTGAYAAVNIAGPRAREVLAPMCEVDLEAEAFPYMGVREGLVAGIPALLMRVGFVGELGYEIHVPADHGEALWDAVAAAGAGAGIRPFGVEAQRVLRLEKGHIIIGQDTDGLTTPHEADMAWAISRRKPYFVGKRSVEIQEAAGLMRKLVGFAVVDADAPVPEESHLVIREGEIVGRVTSCVASAAVGKTIGLAYVAPDQAEPGTRFEIKAGGGQMVTAEVVPLPFYDPDNKRQEM